jgi:pantothenate kinase
MDERSAIETSELSPYRRFSRSEWAALRADTPLTLTIDDLAKLQSINDPISVEEVIAIYLPLSRLLALYVAATQGLFKATQRFLGAEDGKVPYIIGIAGSVAVGKSTTARVLKALLSRWPNTPKVELVTTDGFLLPNAVLQREGIMEKKGFPESYDGAALVRGPEAALSVDGTARVARMWVHLRRGARASLPLGSSAGQCLPVLSCAPAPCTWPSFCATWKSIVQGRSLSVICL